MGYLPVPFLQCVGRRRDKKLLSEREGFPDEGPPEAFDPMSLFPGKTEEQTAEALAAYFNRISSECQPLEPGDIPRTHCRALPTLKPYQVEGRIRAFKKPKSMVKGDIFPALMDHFCSLLVIPLLRSIMR